MLRWNTPGRILEALIGDEIRTVERERELVPEGRIATCYKHITSIGGLKQAIAWDWAQRILRPVEQRGHLLVPHDAAGLKGQCAGQQRYLDRLARRAVVSSK